jgi:hypothetical protein
MTPQARLLEARRHRRACAERCPHWDYENDGYDHAAHDCCLALEDAERDVERLTAAVAKSRRVPFVDVTHETAYGQTSPLSFAVRCF